MISRKILCSPKILRWNLIQRSIQQYNTESSDMRVIDLRSDVLTQPSPEMRKIMAEAKLADDVFRECPTTNALEDRVAKMFGKEAALFVPTGTMGNLISVMAHCRERGKEVLLGNRSHIFMWEQGGIAALGGLHPCPLENLPDGTFSIREMEAEIKPDDPHYTETGLICVENTHNFCGGKVLSLQWLKELRNKANEYGLPIHMDGARIMNAAVALNVDVTEILQYVDSVNMCFSKGLGTPVGSIIAGSQEFKRRTIRLRKQCGGGMRGPGVLAAAADYALDHMRSVLEKDHQHARMIVNAIYEHGHGVLVVNPEDVPTNLMLIDIDKEGLQAPELCHRLSKVTDQEYQDLKMKISVKVYPARLSNKRIRGYTLCNVSKEDTELAIKKILYVCKEYSEHSASVNSMKSTLE